MKTTLNTFYPFQVWATTLIGGPFLGILLNGIRRPDTFNVGYLLGGPLVIGLGGAFFSLPAFVIYYFIYRKLRDKIQSEIKLKFILCPISFVGFTATIYFFFGTVMFQPTNRDGFLMALSYGFCVLTSTFIFKIYKVESIYEPKPFSFEEKNKK